jgi:hypothetical protein
VDEASIRSAGCSHTLKTSDRLFLRLSGSPSQNGCYAVVPVAGIVRVCVVAKVAGVDAVTGRHDQAVFGSAQIQYRETSSR